METAHPQVEVRAAMDEEAPRALVQAAVAQFTADQLAAATASYAHPQDEDAIRDHLPRQVVHIQGRLQRQQNSLDILQGKLVNLTQMVAQIASSLGEQQLQEGMQLHNPACGFEVQRCHHLFARPPPQPTNIRDASNVLDATPSCYGYGSILGQPHDLDKNLVHNRGTQRVFDEMSQPYGLHCLDCRNLTLADGTVHSYFTLPADYPLEQAVPEPVFDIYDDETEDCSNAFVDVFASTPDQQLYEEEQPETEHSSACLNISSDVLDFTLELQRQDDDRACNCPVIKASNSSATMSSQLSIEHSMRELRLLWDPGASASLHSSKAEPRRELSYVTIVISKVLNLCNQVGIYVQQLRDPSWNVLVVPQRRKEWDPGEHTILSSTLNRDIVGVLQTSILTTSGIFTLPCVLAVRIKFGVSKYCVPQQCYCRVPSRLINHGIQFLWDSGILNQIDMMGGKTTVPNLVHSGQTPCKLLNFIGQPVDLKQFWAQLLLQSRTWYNTPNVCLQVQYCCLQIVLACQYSEPVQQLVCYSCMFSSTEATMSTIFMSTAATLRMILVLSYGEIAQEGRDAAAVYHIFKIQLPISKTSHIWDPGIDSLLFVYIWLHVHMIKLVDCSLIHAYYLVSALLPPTQFAAKGPSNNAVGELTSRRLVFHLHQITKWTSTSSNGITSSEYAYTMDFLIDQWEFFHQQGVHENYNAKHLLLSSKKYLQIWEIDIIFITFRPP